MPAVHTLRVLHRVEALVHGVEALVCFLGSPVSGLYELGHYLRQPQQLVRQQDAAKLIPPFRMLHQYPMQVHHGVDRSHSRSLGSVSS